MRSFVSFGQRRLPGRGFRRGAWQIDDIIDDPDVTGVGIIGEVSEDLVLVAVTVTLTPASSSPWQVPDYIGALSVTVDGASSGGAGSGGVDSTITQTTTPGGNSTAGGNSTFNSTQIGNGGSVATGGADAGSRSSRPTPGAAGTNGTAGTASGGDTNTSGGAAAAAGSGGAAVTGADAGTGTYTSGKGGDGAKGGRAVKAWAYGVLKPSSAIPFAVGSKGVHGNAGTSTGVDGTFALNGNAGTDGSDGSIVIVYTTFSFVSRKARNYIEQRPIWTH